MNNNSMNINLNRVMVIDRLNSKLATLKTELAQAQERDAVFNAKKQEWQKAVVKCILEALENGAGIRDVDQWSTHTGLRVNVDTNHITQPTRPNDQSLKSVDRIEPMVEEITKMLSILEMCPDETIKSKQYGNVLQFIS